MAVGAAGCRMCWRRGPFDVRKGDEDDFLHLRAKRRREEIREPARVRLRKKALGTCGEEHAREVNDDVDAVDRGGERLGL
jgi:hypothetical protein